MRRKNWGWKKGAWVEEGEFSTGKGKEVTGRGCGKIIGEVRLEVEGVQVSGVDGSDVGAGVMSCLILGSVDVCVGASVMP